MNLSNTSILITGGTGTVGHSLLSAISALPQESWPRCVNILSRDEYKQHLSRKHFPSQKYPFINYVLADVSNYSLLLPHFQRVDIVIHAAALKRVETGENQPGAFVQTNVNGTTNVLNAALAQGISQVITLSTDKAVYPTTLYGATKLCAERLTLQSNQEGLLKSSVIRLGNIFGSRGSVVPELLENQKKSTVEITHAEMSRFTMSASESAQYILGIVPNLVGGEILIPKMKAYRLIDLVKEIMPHAEITYSSPRFTEKIHETLISQEEARFSYERTSDFIISMNPNTQALLEQSPEVQRSDYESYTSDKAIALSRSEIAKLISTLR